ncbi:MAG: beta-ketoacyl-[acyl-carrier-protein] synthase family protein [Anaerolineales bacterium]|nr:beta-ketoacyl-[acyl-carrier-protein] synthase family protein [Anaerolineales bacterium]
MERVVITGMGVASPLGCTVQTFWEGLLAGRSGVVPVTEAEFGALRTRIGARLAGYDERQYFDAKEARRMSRSSQMAVAATTQAVAQAGLTPQQIDYQEVGVIIASSIGGFAASDGFFKAFYVKGTSNPLIIPISMNSAPSSNVSIRFGFQGPMLTVDAACASSAHAIGYCYNLIRAGQLDMAVTGGSDCPFAPGVVAAWCALRALSERNDEPETACRPFSADRDGLVLGEGAAIFVMESETSAQRRGQPILAEVLGYAAASDSYHLTQPVPDGPARAMRRALTNAGVTPEQIDWINAHGTATIWNDKTETAAIKMVAGDHAYQVPVVSLKAGLGHAIAASAALQTAAAILSIRDQTVPPTSNYRVRDPECDLDYVTEGPRRQAISRVLGNSFAFGGSNAALVIARYEPREG